MNADHSGLLAHRLAEELAPELGPDWTLNTSPDTATLATALIDGPHGARLHLGLPQHTTTRVTVTGVLPHQPGDPHHAAPSITVFWNHGPRVIAAQIIRLLLPTYLEALPAAADRQARKQNYATGRRRVAERITTLMPGTTVADLPNSTALRLNAPGQIYGKIHIDLDASTLRLELGSLPTETALRILTVLTDPTHPDPAGDSPETSRDAGGDR